MSHALVGDELAILHKVAFKYLFDFQYWGSEGWRN